jgi:hypothetical protein
MSYVSSMSTFDYAASAELFTAQGRPGFRYQRFAQAAEAIRYAIEKLSPKVLAGSSLEVKDERYNAKQIRALYESARYPSEPQKTLFVKGTRRSAIPSRLPNGSPATMRIAFAFEQPRCRRWGRRRVRVRCWLFECRARSSVPWWPCRV